MYGEMTLRRVPACMYVYECVVECACAYLLVQGGLANVCIYMQMSSNVNTLEMLPRYLNYKEDQQIKYTYLMFTGSKDRAVTL